MKNDDDNLQSLCRKYLKRLRYTAKKHGIGAFVDGMIAANRRRECRATEKEVNMLARCVDDERITRGEVPEVLGKSYRQCVEDGDFDRIDKLHRVGIYSKISALMKKKD